MIALYCYILVHEIQQGQLIKKHIVPLCSLCVYITKFSPLKMLSSAVVRNRPVLPCIWLWPKAWRIRREFGRPIFIDHLNCCVCGIIFKRFQSVKIGHNEIFLILSDFYPPIFCVCGIYEPLSALLTNQKSRCDHMVWWFYISMAGKGTLFFGTIIKMVN